MNISKCSIVYVFQHANHAASKMKSNIATNWEVLNVQHQHLAYVQNHAE